MRKKDVTKMIAGTTDNGDGEMNCEQVLRDEVAEKYLLGQLSDAEREAFERHYFECSRCIEELQTYQALQETLRDTAKVIQPEPTSKRAVSHWTWAAAAAGVLLVIGTGYWLERPRPPSPSPSATAILPAPKIEHPPATRVLSASELAEVQPPNYTPVILRGVPDEATLRFHEAMLHYMKRDYAGTIPGLYAASQLNSKAPNISFFLGICYLLTGQTNSAIAQLRRTAALGDSPYSEETRFYLAKAYVRKADFVAARTELRRVILLQGEREKEARELLGQLESLSEAPR
jgi:tetratricopeptide (TPR) repeat protein